MATKPFEIVGMDALLKKMDSFSKELKEDIAEELFGSARTIASEAQRAAPVDLGALQRGISAFQVGELTFEVASNADYSPYVEFGTGGLVSVPSGLEDYAIQFKGKGIKEVNLAPRPFFFPAFEKEKVELIKRIKELLKDIKT